MVVSALTRTRKVEGTKTTPLIVDKRRKEESTSSTTPLSRQEEMTQMFQKKVKEIQDAIKKRDKEKAEFAFIEHDDEGEWTQVNAFSLGTLQPDDEHLEDHEWVELLVDQ
jgi:hypothetical protein